MIDDLNTLPLPHEEEEVFEASLVADVRDETETGESTRVLAGDGTDAPAGETRAEQPPWVGRVLGHFKLLRLIGHGMMGFVVQAIDVDLERVVALKILRKRIEGVDETKRVEQFFREARGAAQIEHPNVVRIYEISQHKGWWYIAMEMLEGEDLKKIVKAAGPLPPSRACPILADAATALTVAHESGIIHRDVKPSNLMVTRAGRCKLTDFGFVRRNDPSDPFDFTDKSVGTPQYMAPEVIRNERQTSAVDVYSLGATLYYALTGRAPFLGRSVIDICRKHLDEPVPDVRDLSPSCPESLSALVRRAMGKSASARPTAAAFAAILRAEAIAHRDDDSSVLASHGSSVLAQPIGEMSPRATPESSVVTTRGRLEARPSRFSRLIRSVSTWLLVGTAALGFVGGLTWHSFTGSGGGTKGPNGPPSSLAERFADAPATYGVLPPGAVPEAVGAGGEPPAFSWIGRTDVTGLRYVAGKRGRHYYRVDAPEAALIRLEDLVGYRTADEARADGRTPAP